MAIMLKRQLNDEEKAIILQRHGRNCFATGHIIDDNDKVHFDHIKAFAKGGESELDNIAPMCEHHNKAKGTLPLGDFRTKLRLQDFFKLGDRLTLKNLLEYMKSKNDIEVFGETITAATTDNQITLTNHGYNQTFQLQTCPLTNWKYFYGNLPVSLLDSDDENDNSIGLQPRYLIFDKVFEMYRHFQYYPVLQPSIGRLNGNKILLFDGQHKAASLLWNNRKIFECKIYISPELRILNQANISAHDKFAQTRFFSSIMILKLGAQFGKDFEDYRNTEDNQSKTEQGFIEFLSKKDASLTKADVNKRFKSYLYNSILEDESNKIKHLISTSNRSTGEQPLTIDMLSKSIFGCFLYTEPLNDDMLSDNYKRELEAKNIITLFNMLWDLALSSWNKNANQNDLSQNRLRRIFSSKSIMAWSELFRDAVCAKLEIHDQDEQKKIFYREISEDQQSKIKQILERLINWQMWQSPRDSEIDTIIAGNKSAIKDWFRNKGLTTGFLLGAPI